MSTKIILKKSSVASKIPTTGDLDYGELAINYAEGRLYYKNSSNVIKNFIDSDNLLSVVYNTLSTLQSLDSNGIIALIAADGFTKYDSDNFNSQFNTKSTTDLTEGTNLYYTTLRADSDAKAAISGSTGITYSNGVISTNDAQIVHDNLSGFVANEHIDHSSVTLTAGVGLTGGGDITTSRSFSIDSAELYAYFNHDGFTGFVSNEHIDHTTITLTAGDGLTGGGDITANRTFAVGAGTGVTVSADAVSIGQSVGTTDNVTFNQVSVKTLEVDSSAAFTLIDYLKRPTYVEGTMWYDEDEHAIAYHTADSDYIHYTGQRGLLRGRNSTGSTILKGTPVYSAGVHISGHPIHGHHPLIYPADASDINKIDVIGIAAQNIADGTHGYVITRGWLDGLNTADLTTGTPFHLGPGGGYIDNAATYPNYPVQLGFILTQDSVGGNGSIYVDIISHTFDQLRVGGTTRIDGDTTIGGNLTVLGTQTVASSENIQIGGAFNYFNGGDTIGETNTAFQGSGLDDATFTGHYTGTTTGQTFYVKIDGTGTPDTFEWGYDSASPQASGVSITDSDQVLNYGISVDFVATTGHTVGDKWTGSASPVNVDTGWFTNRNTGTSGVGYTHAGMFFDVSTEKFTLLSGYDPEPEGTINLADSSTTYGTLKAGTFEGNLTGDVTGTVSGNAGSATQLATGRTIALSGDITATGVSFNGTSNITLTTAYTAGSIVNADINASAGIVDTKLATISTAGKVSNSATTATDANTGSTIVARDVSGNFSAGTITATFSGNLTGDVTGTVSSLSNFATTDLTEGTNKYYTKVRVDSDIDLRVSKAFIDNLNVNADTLDGQHGTYYRINVYNSSGTLLN